MFLCEWHCADVFNETALGLIHQLFWRGNFCSTPSDETDIQQSFLMWELFWVKNTVRNTQEQMCLSPSTETNAYCVFFIPSVLNVQIFKPPFIHMVYKSLNLSVNWSDSVPCSRAPLQLSAQLPSLVHRWPWTSSFLVAKPSSIGLSNCCLQITPQFKN